MWENFFDTMLQIIKQKLVVNTKQCDNDNENYLKKWLESDFYLDAIIHEVEETRPHMKEKNAVYLEDELWDILWDYMNLIYLLEREWKIDAWKVLERSVKKYSERTNALENWMTWDEIKKIQKQKLLQEHNAKYND